jgi:clavaminate synthase
LRNLPVELDDKLPPTPSTAAPEDRPLLNIAAMLGIVGSRLGLHTAYDQGYGNRLSRAALHELHPRPEAHPLSQENAKVQLEFHSDLPHQTPCQPNYIMLACSRAHHERQAATLAGSMRRALPLLSDGVRNRLFDRVFPRRVYTELRDRFANPGATAHIKPLYGDVDDPYSCYDRSFLTAEEPADRKALATLSQALDTVAEPIVLIPGDLLVIDNFRVTHARTPFAARWDGKNRWLHRAHARSNRNRQFSGGERAGDIVPFALRREQGFRSWVPCASF